MEDADKNSKSLVLITRVGSTPTTGIKRKPSSLSGGAFFLSAACERVEQHDPAQQGSNQPCGLLLSARETPHHRHSKQLEIERFWAAFLFLLSFLYFGVFWEDAESL